MWDNGAIEESSETKTSEEITTDIETITKDEQEAFFSISWSFSKSWRMTDELKSILEKIYFSNKQNTTDSDYQWIDFDKRKNFLFRKYHSDTFQWDDTYIKIINIANEVIRKWIS